MNGAAEESSSDEEDSEEEEVGSNWDVLLHTFLLWLRWKLIRTGRGNQEVMSSDCHLSRKTNKMSLEVRPHPRPHPLHSDVLSLCVCVGTLFVGNLSFDVDEDLLQEFVTSQGHTPSSVRVITSYDGRSKGYAVCFIHTPFCLNILYSTLGTRLGPILYCVLCTIIFANCNTCACECAYTCTCSISSSQQRPLEFIM